MRYAVALVCLGLVVAVAIAIVPSAWHGGVAVVGVLVAGAMTLRRGEHGVPFAVAVQPQSNLVHELRSLLALLPEGILLVDADENVLVANPAVARILRRERIAMEGVSLTRATRDAALVHVLREAAGVPRDISLSDDRLVRASAARLDAPPVHAVLTVQDVTVLRNAERARSELIANVSHELRTPITAARALAETLEAGVDEPEQRERFHARLTRELERLGEIVERLLKLSRLESRVEEFDVQPIDASELGRVAMTRLRPVADRAGVTLVLDGEAQDGGSVLADRERTLEVLTNLLDNAIRYSPAGGAVRIAIEPVGPMIRFCVRDQGPGILPADRQRIFERFYTVDRARGGDTGTGLGLAIARHIVSRLGGEIWVADESPGATLCFTLQST